VKCAIENIKVARNPLVVIWFGTCELSTKSGKFSDIIRNPYQTIERLASLLSRLLISFLILRIDMDIRLGYLPLTARVSGVFINSYKETILYFCTEKQFILLSLGLEGFKHFYTF
jgi:hypothetical protein